MVLSSSSVSAHVSGLLLLNSPTKEEESILTSWAGVLGLVCGLGPSLALITTGGLATGVDIKGGAGPSTAELVERDFGVTGVEPP